jgi:hypothetical protein
MADTALQLRYVNLSKVPTYSTVSALNMLTILLALITTYHELNPSTIEELHEEPSPLEFMRYVSRNRPFVVRKGAQDWPACQKWNAKYLHQIMKGQTVNVAMTPLGRIVLFPFNSGT